MRLPKTRRAKVPCRQKSCRHTQHRTTQRQKTPNAIHERAYGNAAEQLREHAGPHGQGDLRGRGSVALEGQR